jgi:hypothetical protein
MYSVSKENVFVNAFHAHDFFVNAFHAHDDTFLYKFVFRYRTRSIVCIIITKIYITFLQKEIEIWPEFFQPI